MQRYLCFSVRFSDNNVAETSAAILSPKRPESGTNIYTKLGDISPKGNMGQFAETHFAESGKVSLPCRGWAEVGRRNEIENQS